MAKTVFGMPGAGKEQKGGDAVAPQGTPGAQSGQALPQKKGEEKKVPKAPPIAAPMAKPAPKTDGGQASPKSGPPGPSGNKTMFGMPAMKLPVQQGASPAPAGPPVQPKESAAVPPSQQFHEEAQAPATVEQDARQPLPPLGAQNTADAFKATELGMPPVGISDAPEPLEEEPAPQSALENDAEPSWQLESESWASEGSGVQSVRQGATGGGSKAWIWIVLGSILVVLAAIGIAVYFLMVRPMAQASEEVLRQLPIQQGVGIPPTMPVQPDLQPGQAPPQPTPMPQQ